jgi:regulator of RNase E activity RraA
MRNEGEVFIDSSEVVKFIKQNRISTTEICDAVGKTGALGFVAPVTFGLHRVGSVRHIVLEGESNAPLHQEFTKILEGEIVLIQPKRSGIFNVSPIGELMVKQALLYSGAQAVVCSGPIRDLSRIRREGYAVWSVGANPIGMTNDPLGSSSFGDFHKGIAVCDDGGVSLVQSQVNLSTLCEQLALIEIQEDIWSFCLNTLRWNTFETIVMKRYLTEPEELPATLRKYLPQLRSGFDKLQ